MNEPSHQANAAGLSEADQNINNTAEDISHAASGHKANLSNPSTYPVLYLKDPHTWEDATEMRDGVEDSADAVIRHERSIKGEVQRGFEEVGR
jgi:hypothetical protein